MLLGEKFSNFQIGHLHSIITIRSLKIKFIIIFILNSLEKMLKITQLQQENIF
jgi:hypothetical protein